MSHPPLYLCPHMKTKTPTKKKPPAVTCKNNQIIINPKAVNELFEQTMAGLMALRDAWEISQKEESK
jgi:hypothetical protein